MTALDTKALLETLSRFAILLGAVGAIVLVVEEPMTGGSWATRLRGQPALTLRAEPASSLVGSRFDQAQKQ